MRKKTIAFIGDTSVDDYQSQMLAGAMKAAEENDFNLVRFTIETYINANRYPYPLELMTAMIKKVRPDGLLFLGWSGDIAENPKKFLGLLKDLMPLPLVSIGREVENITSIHMKGGEHVKELLEHLTQKHHYKNIVFVKPIIPDNRYQDYEAYMKEHGLFKKELVLTNEDLDKPVDWFFVKRAKKIAAILFDKRKIEVDAIMSMYTYESLLILDKLKARNLRVPDDIALTSWEDGDRGRYSNPSFTSVYYPYYQQAYVGCLTILKMIGGEKAPLLIPVQGEIRIRRSCGCDSSRLDRVKIDILENRKTAAGNIESAKLKQDFKASNLTLKILDFDKILSGFQSDIKNKSETRFLKTLESNIFAHGITVEELYNLQQDILTFRSFITPCLKGQSEQAENIWLKSQIVIQEHIEAVLGFSDVLRRGSSHVMQEIGQNIVITFNINKLLDVFESSLKRINVPNCHIFLFPDGKDTLAKERLVFSLINGKRAEPKSRSISKDAKNQLESLLYDKESHTFLVYFIHIHQELIGYIIFEPGPVDERLYNTLSIELSSAIHGALVLDNLKKANLSLKSAQKEIMKNMEIIQEKTAALEDSNQKLSQLDRLKNDFIANITHDFRSPLMIILNTADLGLRYDNTQDFKNIIRRYSIIYNASLKLKMSIDRLLDLAKMDAQGVKLNVQKLMLRSYIEHITDFYLSATMSTQIQFHCRLPSYEINDFYTDVDKLEEILNNIISNALKFVDPGSGIITISLQDKESSIELSITDNGIGIPRDKLDVIFGRFEQLENGANGRFKGTGIGLAFVKELTGYLRGTVRAESDGPDKGSRFILELKKGKDIFKDLEILEDAADIKNSESGKRKEFHSIITSDLIDSGQKDEIVTDFPDLNKDNEFEPQKGVILIVDDNFYIRDIVKEYLIKAGYKNFIMAGNGKSGIEAIYQYRPDLIISDYNMPKMRGDELHDQLLSNPDFKKTPILFLTAMTDKTLMLERKQKGALAYLNKPVDERELVVNIDMHIRKYMEYKLLLQQASTDELTGLANKHTILKFLNDRVMLRTFRNLSLIFMDIDHFKNFNDTHGHPAGDVLLAQIGKIIKESLRSYDKAGRYGGEEFLIVLPEATLNDAAIVAEKLRVNIKSTSVNLNDKLLNVTSSFGVSSLINNEAAICENLKINGLREIFEIQDIKSADWEKIEGIKKGIKVLLIDMADKALYQAKNTVCTNCDFRSEKSELFIDNKCPKCGSDELFIGRDKTAVFQG